MVLIIKNRIVNTEKHFSKYQDTSYIIYDTHCRSDLDDEQGLHSGEGTHLPTVNSVARVPRRDVMFGLKGLIGYIRQKPTFLNSNSICIRWTKSHLVDVPLLIPILFPVIPPCPVSPTPPLQKRGNLLHSSIRAQDFFPLR